MQVIKFLNKVKGVEKLHPLTPENFWRLISSKNVSEVTEYLRNKENSPAFRYNKKRELGAIYWKMLTSSKLNTRMSGKPSHICVLDIDHFTDNPRGFYSKYIMNRVEELGILFVQVSPSGDGLHIGFKANPEIKTIAGQHFWLAQQIGTSNWDRCCTDLKRCFFVSPKEDWLYINKDLFNIINMASKEAPKN